MDRIHVQCVAEHESDPFPAAQIGDPIPGEDALRHHDEIVLVGSYGSQKSIGFVRQFLCKRTLPDWSMMQTNIVLV